MLSDSGKTLVRHRWWILSGFLALVGLSAIGLPRLQLELGLDRVLEPGLDELRRAEALYEDTPLDLVDATVVLTSPAAMDQDGLERLGGIVERIEADDRLDVITSLATVTVMDDLSPIPIPRKFPATVGDRSVTEAVRKHPLLHETLLSSDGRSTILLLGSTDRGHDAIAALVAELPDLMTGLVGDDVRVRVLGSMVIENALRDRMSEDLVRIIGLEVILFLLILPLIFRTARGSLLPILTVIGAMTLNFGWMAWLGVPFAMIDMAIPGLIVIIGLSDAVHMIHRFEEEYAEHGDRSGAIATMMERVGRACFYTSFTTGVGFLSLVLTEHETVRAFGVKAAISVVVTFGAVVVVVPAALALWPIRKPVSPRQIHIGWLGFGRPAPTLFITAVALVVTAIGISRIQVDSHLLEEFPDADPVSQDLRWFERTFGGLLYVETAVSGPLDDPAVFAAVEEFQSAMLDLDGVVRVDSYSLWVREALGNPAGPLSGAQLRSAFQRLSVVPGVFPRNLITQDLRHGRMVFFTRDVGARRTLAMRDDIRRLAAALPDSVTVEPAGYTFMAARASEVVIAAMTRSLAASLITITLFLCIIFRSARIGLLCVIPNTLPVAVALGLAGWTGIGLRMGSALIYCLGLGLAVDDTIHLVTRYLQERAAHPDRPVRETLLTAMRSSGKALITTSLVLGIGTLCHLVGSFQSIQQVGVLLFSVIVAALIADLWLLPLLMLRARVR